MKPKAKKISELNVVTEPAAAGSPGAEAAEESTGLSRRER